MGTNPITCRPTKDKKMSETRSKRYRGSTVDACRGIKTINAKLAKDAKEANLARWSFSVPKKPRKPRNARKTSIPKNRRSCVLFILFPFSKMSKPRVEGAKFRRFSSNSESKSESSSEKIDHPRCVRLVAFVGNSINSSRLVRFASSSWPLSGRL